MIVEFMLSAVLHQCCACTDEYVRYQQCADRAARIAQEAQEEEWYDVTTSWGDYTCYAASNDTFYAEDGISAAEFQWRGVVEDESHFYTWYSENVLPGGGLTELNANGRHSEGGFVKDGDGYIAVASCDYTKGTVIDTPFGQAKVYDTGYLAPGQVDVYTSF